MYKLSKQTILNQIAGLASNEEPDEKLIKGLAALLPSAGGPVIVNGFKSISLITGKLADFDVVVDEAQEHIDAVTNYACKVNDKFLTDEYSGFGAVCDEHLSTMKSQAIKVRKEAIGFYAEVGLTVMERKLTYTLSDDAEEVTQKQIEQALNLFQDLDQFIDVRVSNSDKKVEIWVPSSLDNLVVRQMILLQQVGEFDPKARFVIEATEQLIPGAKDWIDMERRIELKRELYSEREHVNQSKIQNEKSI
jgi:hypothetical protein